MRPIESRIESHKKKIKRFKRMKMIVRVCTKLMDNFSVPMNPERFNALRNLRANTSFILQKIEKKISKLEDEVRILSIIKEELHSLQLTK